MPEIPANFTVDRTPFSAGQMDARANPQAFAAEGAALGEAGQQVQAVGAQFTKQIADSRAAIAADNIANQYMQQVNAAAVKYSNMPDHVAAEQGFNQEVEQIREQAANASQDPMVQAAVLNQLNRHSIWMGDSVLRSSFALEGSKNRADADQKLDQYAKDAAGAGTPGARDNAIQNGLDTLRRLTDAGYIQPEQAEERRQQFGATVLAGALEANPQQTLADLNAGRFNNVVTQRTLDTLRPRIDLATGAAAAAPIVQGFASGTGGNWEIAHNNFAGMRIPAINAGPNTGGFQAFNTPEEGVAAISHQLDRYASGATTGQPINTLRGIVTTWAPPTGPDGGNPTSALIARAAKVTGFDPDQPLNVGDPATKQKLVEAMIRGEQGGNLPISQDVIARGVAMTPTTNHGGSLAAAYNRIDQMGLNDVAATRAKEIVRTQVDAIQADQMRNLTLQQKAQRDASETAEKEYIADAQSGTPKMSARDVANDSRLTPEAQLRMIAFLGRDGLVENGVSHQTAVRLMQGIGDGTITDRGQIIDAFNQGKLNWGDFDHLNQQLQQIQTPAGEVLAKRKEQFIKSQLSEIAPKGLLGQLDPQEDARLYDFRWHVDEKIDEYRKSGKNPADLLDPSKPDFLGKPEAVKPFASPFAQKLQDAANPGAAPDLSRAATLPELQAIVAKNPALRDQAIAIATQRGWLAAPLPDAPQPQAPLR